MRYKLLEDFSCYDADGVTNTPLSAVQAVFPTETDAFGSMKDLIKAGLEEDAMLQARQDKAVPEIVKQVQAVLPAFEQSVKEGKGIKKSAAKATQTVHQELRPAAYSREDVFDKNAKRQDHRAHFMITFSETVLSENEKAGIESTRPQTTYLHRLFLVYQISCVVSILQITIIRKMFLISS